MALGDGGAGDGALGRAAMIRRAAACIVLLALPLGGCHSAAQLTGLVSGGVAGFATASPAVGYLVGITTTVAADEAYKWYGRSRSHAEQQAIADSAAVLPEGGAAPWRIDHLVPIGDEHGEVRVVRVLDSPLAQCRELVFSVQEKAVPPHWYATSICRATDGWHWALAEPAVPRWTFLQQGAD